MFMNPESVMRCFVGIHARNRRATRIDADAPIILLVLHRK